MTLGRMNWVGANQKGFDDIFMALNEMTPEQRAGIHLTVIGQGDERPRLRAIGSVIPDIEIDFVAGLPNAQVRQLLREVDGVILASRYEGMSVFALEAVGSGAPVIFSDAGGIAGLVRGNGRRFVAGNPRSLAQAWGDMLAEPPEQWQAMSQASLAVAAELTPDRAARALIRFLGVLQSQAHGGGAR
jgi:glycosyltransferase involved in cell wall biosynthesis